jgi:imidazolonepropionase-like amidohydrolase
LHTIIKNGKVFTGLNDKLEDLTIVIEGKRIKEVASEINLDDYPDAKIVDAKGQTVLPGLIDCHVHIASEGNADFFKTQYDAVPRQTLRAAMIAKKMLDAGFTTVRNMGSGDNVDIELAKAIDQGMVEGCRIIPSGRCICMTGGHGWFNGREVDGPNEARKGAREQLKAGAQVIKIMATGGVMTEGVEPGSPQLTIEEMKAAVEEAHKAGRKTATHAQGTEGIKNAILAGLDTIEHGIFLNEEVINMMLERNVALIPTLVAPYQINKGGIEAGIPEYAVKKSMRIADSHVNSYKMALDAGVTIAMGTDSGTPLNKPGKNAMELELMVEHGMDEVTALKAATSVAAKVIDRSDIIGSLEAGKFADIVIFEGNPLEDIKVLHNKPTLIIKEGKQIN